MPTRARSPSVSQQEAKRARLTVDPFELVFRRIAEEELKEVKVDPPIVIAAPAMAAAVPGRPPNCTCQDSCVAPFTDVSARFCYSLGLSIKEHLFMDV